MPNVSNLASLSKVFNGGVSLADTPSELSLAARWAWLNAQNVYHDIKAADAVSSPAPAQTQAGLMPSSGDAADLHSGGVAAAAAATLVPGAVDGPASDGILGGALAGGIDTGRAAAPFSMSADQSRAVESDGSLAGRGLASGGALGSTGPVTNTFSSDPGGLLTSGDFATGDFTGWSLFTTANGTLGHPGLPAVTSFNVTGLGVQNAANFQVGDAVFDGTQQGGGIFQTVNLPGGPITFSADIAALGPYSAGSTNVEGGVFTILLDGVVEDTVDIGAINANEVIRNDLAFTANVGAGSHTVEIEVTRPYDTGPAFGSTPQEFVTNVSAKFATTYSIKTVDVTPVGDSSETAQSSEPSIAVNPLNPSQIITGAFSETFAADGVVSPFFITTDGGKTWSDYGSLDTLDKTLAWTQDGSQALAATLTGNTDIDTYSAPVGGSFGPLNHFAPASPDNLDQPWLRTGPVNHVYVSYNNLNNYGPGNTASVNVSTDGGVTFTPVVIEKVGAGAGQDSPGVRTAVNGSTVYGTFIRWDSVKDNDGFGETRFNAHVVIVRSDNAGGDSFSALGAGGVGANVAADTAVFANTENAPLTVGQERTGGGIAIAVDPADASRVFVAYEDSQGAIGDGRLQLDVAESLDGGATWATKFVTPLATRSGQPALAVTTDGTVGFLYDNYDPGTNLLSQHLVTTADDFFSTTDNILGTETNSTPSATFSPYLGDFFDLEAVGKNFFGIFSASNADNGTNATIANVTYQRHFTGTAGTASFQLTDGVNPIANSIDPYFFTATPDNIYVYSAVTSTGDVVGSGQSEIVLSGGRTVNASVLSDGAAIVRGGGVASGTVVSGGGIETVSSGGEATGAALRGGRQDVYSGGVVSGTTVSGGSEYVSSGAVAVANAVRNGGNEYVYGVAIGDVVSSGGRENVSSGGTASGTVVLGSGSEYVYLGGAALGTVLSGGTETVYGFASGTSVTNNGDQFVSSGGVVQGAVLTSHGSQDVVSSGTTSSTVLMSGGRQYVWSGGTASGTSVGKAGIQFLRFGGRAIGTVLLGGAEVVSSGGTASGTIVKSGGAETVLNGGTTSGGVLHGGHVEVASGGTAIGTLSFGGGGTLQLDATTGFTGKLKGFTVPDRIDLRSITFGAGTKRNFVEAASHTSGTLTVTDGTHTTHLTLLGTYTTSSFKLTDDGLGDTLVTDPPVTHRGGARTTFGDIARDQPLAGAARSGHQPSYLPGAPATNHKAYTGELLLATIRPAGPGGGDHNPLR